MVSKNRLKFKHLAAVSVGFHHKTRSDFARLNYTIQVTEASQLLCLTRKNCAKNPYFCSNANILDDTEIFAFETTSDSVRSAPHPLWATQYFRYQSMRAASTANFTAGKCKSDVTTYSNLSFGPIKALEFE